MRLRPEIAEINPEITAFIGDRPDGTGDNSAKTKLAHPWVLLDQILMQKLHDLDLRRSITSPRSGSEAANLSADRNQANADNRDSVKLFQVGSRKTLVAQT